LTKIEGDYKIAIRNLNPRWIVKYINDFESILKRQKIVDMDIVIQSGSKRILKLMQRFSDVEKIKELCLCLKKFDPNLTLYTHIIVGFPTETLDDIKQTLTLIVESCFDSGKGFPFSCKIGTDAEKIEPKVPQIEISKRFRYAKNFLKKAGYDVIYIHKPHLFVFNKRN
jgi:tRNA-2-methylthio-N6-dimethylallyladenosine synthase